MTGEPGYISATIEIPPAEAAAGTVRSLWSPTHGPLHITVPPGTTDGAVLWVDSPSGKVAVTVRVTLPFPAPAPVFAGPPVAVQRSGRRNQLIGLGVAAVLLAGCIGVIGAFSGGDDDEEPVADTLIATGTTTAPATVPTTTAPSTPEQYAALLTGSDNAIKASFGKLNTSDNKAFAKAAPAAAASIRNEAGKLRASEPPAGAESVHEDLAQQLESFGDIIEETAGTKQECPAASPYASVLQSGWADGIRADVKKLTSANGKYRFGTFLPAAPKDQNRRLSNGKYVKRTSTGGLGHLKIENGGDDTTVSLVKGKKTVFTVYVRGGKTYTAKGIKDGTYRIYTATGADWNSAKKGFTRDCGFSKFDDTFKFSTTSRTSSIWTITLTPVVGGNATTSDVDPDAFPQ
ncbi:hypothetical protein [Winogradskya humida]|uniref:Uncharacterized protein n=1 Tax=Winogradskya humida TaxID=113566 RepID=A0ABQ3ZQ33_9ACTN|nr:hypothetical protein [Actinoplanes humidus]GIE20603.1 hypothetical protein Ahu01nite_037050 [Actinoplanes humidus]